MYNINFVDVLYIFYILTLLIMIKRFLYVYNLKYFEKHKLILKLLFYF